MEDRLTAVGRTLDLIGGDLHRSLPLSSMPSACQDLLGMSRTPPDSASGASAIRRSLMYHLLATLLLALLIGLIGSGCGGLSEAEKHNNAGAANHSQGRFEETIAEYDEAIRLNPLLTVAYNNRGLAYIRLGKHRRAINDLNEAIRLNPNDAAVHSNRGLAYLKLGQPLTAVNDLDEAIRLNPKLLEAFMTRSSAFGELGHQARAMRDFDRVIEDLNETIQRNPGESEPYRRRGVAYRTLASFKRLSKT